MSLSARGASFFRCLPGLFKKDQKLVVQSLLRPLSTTSDLCRGYPNTEGPKGWPMYNKQVYPPTELGEKPRPAFVCHMKTNIKYSPLKLWYVACLVRGMQIDNAIRQLEYVNRKGAKYVRETLIEAQELAVREHNVEFRSNLWVAESFTGKGLVVKGLRRHARGRMGFLSYRYTHYFVRLEEGPPPANYYPAKPDGPTMLEEWVKERRGLRVDATY